MPQKPDAPLPGRDLGGRADVHDLVVAFYRELIMDDLLAPMFDEVAEVDWSHHLPLLIDYWCQVLLGETAYRGALVASHRRVHELEAFRPEHFARWYGLWVCTIDDRWAGPVAERAKAHAARIAGSLSRQLTGAGWATAGTATAG